MSPLARSGHASLNMYPFPPLRAAYERYWAAVHRRAPWAPAVLDWERPLAEVWVAPDLVVGQTCGWPLVTSLHHRVRVLGAFEPMVASAEGHRYRSLIVATRDAEIHSFAGSVAAVNSADSLSGWISLVTAVIGAGGTWRGEVVHTGAHLESVRALHERRAEVASIDAVSWAHISTFHPGLVADLVVVGNGPLVGSLPLITAASTTDDQLAELRLALSGAFAEREAGAAMLVARMSGFVPLDVADYSALTALRPGRTVGP